MDYLHPKSTLSRGKRCTLHLKRDVVNELLKMSFSLHIPFLPRDALVHSAVLRLHVVRPSVRLSVRLSVCLSVTLVDQDHIGWKSWKLIARTLSPTPSLFVAKRPSTYSEGNLGKFGGD